jgi:hypothetical protein
VSSALRVTGNLIKNSLHRLPFWPLVYLRFLFHRRLRTRTYLRYGGDTERQRRDRYPDIVSSGRGTSADCRRIHIRAVRDWHHCYRHAGRTSSRWLRGLCGKRSLWLDGRPRPPPKGGKIILGHDCGRDLGGVALNFTSLDPVKALYWSAVVNGLLVAPLMAVMMVVAMNPRIMGRLTLPRPMLVVGWLATLVMALATGGSSCSEPGAWTPIRAWCSAAGVLGSRAIHAFKQQIRGALIVLPAIEPRVAQCTLCYRSSGLNWPAQAGR